VILSDSNGTALFVRLGDSNDLVTVDSIKVSPDPPKPGENLTVIATGTVKGIITEGAYANVKVKLGLIKLLEKEYDLCEEAEKANLTVSCPVQPGQYVIEQTVMLPSQIPKAKFIVEVRAYNEDDTRLVCLNIIIDFMLKFPGLFSKGQ